MNIGKEGDYVADWKGVLHLYFWSRFRWFLHPMHSWDRLL